MVPKPAIEIIGESCYSPGMGSSVPHDFAVSIEPADIDFMGHVNNASYLKWVQAAVLSHWRRIAPPDAVAAHLWVALKHEITYRKPAFLEDQIVATEIGRAHV